MGPTTIKVLIPGELLLISVSGRASSDFRCLGELNKLSSLFALGKALAVFSR